MNYNNGYKEREKFIKDSAAVPATLSEYIDFVVGYIAKGGKVTAFHEYKMDILKCNNSTKLPVLYGANSLNILIPENVTIIHYDTGHTYLYFMSNFTNIGRVAIYLDCIYELHKRSLISDKSLELIKKLVPLRTPEFLINLKNNCLYSPSEIRAKSETIKTKVLDIINKETKERIDFINKETQRRLALTPRQRREEDDTKMIDEFTKNKISEIQNSKEQKLLLEADILLKRIYEERLDIDNELVQIKGKNDGQQS